MDLKLREVIFLWLPIKGITQLMDICKFIQEFMTNRVWGRPLIDCKCSQWKILSKYERTEIFLLTQIAQALS